MKLTPIEIAQLKSLPVKLQEKIRLPEILLMDQITGGLPEELLQYVAKLPLSAIKGQELKEFLEELNAEENSESAENIVSMIRLVGGQDSSSLGYFEAYTNRSGALAVSYGNAKVDGGLTCKPGETAAAFTKRIDSQLVKNGWLPKSLLRESESPEIC